MAETFTDVKVKARTDSEYGRSFTLVGRPGYFNESDDCEGEWPDKGAVVTFTANQSKNGKSWYVTEIESGGAPACGTASAQQTVDDDPRGAAISRSVALKAAVELGISVGWDKDKMQEAGKLARGMAKVLEGYLTGTLTLAERAAE